MNNKSAYLFLSAHALERINFFGIGTIVPLTMWRSGQISEHTFGLIVAFIFFMYRVTPVVGGYIGDILTNRIGMIVGAVFEIFGFIGMLVSNDAIMMYFFALVIGIGGGLFAPALLSILGELNNDKNIFLTHLMLINMAALISPMLALINGNNLSYFFYVMFGAFLFLSILSVISYKQNGTEQRHVKSYFNSMKNMFSDTNFLSIWLISIIVWSASSFIYMILPIKKLLNGGFSNVNIWMMADATMSIIIFYLFRRFHLFSNINSKHFAKGLLFLGSSLLISSASNNLAIIMISVMLLSTGGMIAFPQIYGAMDKISPENSKTLYIGMISVAGAIGEGITQSLFAFYPNPNFFLFSVGIITVLMAIILMYINFNLAD